MVGTSNRAIILVTTGISCTGCISHTHPKCTLQQPVVPESKQQENNESYSSELGSIPGFTGEVEGLGQKEVAEHEDYCVRAINCASAPS